VGIDIGAPDHTAKIKEHGTDRHDEYVLLKNKAVKDSFRLFGFAT